MIDRVPCEANLAPVNTFLSPKCVDFVHSRVNSTRLLFPCGTLARRSSGPIAATTRSAVSDQAAISRISRTGLPLSFSTGIRIYTHTNKHARPVTGPLTNTREYRYHSLLTGRLQLLLGRLHVAVGPERDADALGFANRTLHDTRRGHYRDATLLHIGAIKRSLQNREEGVERHHGSNWVIY